MVKIIYPTDKVKKIEKIFLAGTIDNGKSYNWSLDVINELKDYDIEIYNPRRIHWDSKLEQDKSNPEFNHQVNWELMMLEKSDLVIMNFLPDSKSPISLLELGLFHKKMLVCCPKGFYRKGNVDIVCENYRIPLYDNIKSLMDEVRNRLDNNEF